MSEPTRTIPWPPDWPDLWTPVAPHITGGEPIGRYVPWDTFLARRLPGYPATVRRPWRFFLGILVVLWPLRIGAAAAPFLPRALAVIGSVLALGAAAALYVPVRWGTLRERLGRVEHLLYRGGPLLFPTVVLLVALTAFAFGLAGAQVAVSAGQSSGWVRLTGFLQLLTLVLGIGLFGLPGLFLPILHVRCRGMAPAVRARTLAGADPRLWPRALRFIAGADPALAAWAIEDIAARHPGAMLSIPPDALAALAAHPDPAVRFVGLMHVGDVWMAAPETECDQHHLTL